MTVLGRRGVLAGALLVTFSSRGFGQEGGGGAKAVAPGLPGDLAKFPLLDSWIRIDGQGRVTVFTGKAELGQGIGTALLQLAADELGVPFAAIGLVTADTARTPDEGVTAGSHSMQQSGTAILNAAANVRLLLAREAAGRWTLPLSQVAMEDGTARAPDGRTVPYGVLAAGLSLHVPALPDVPRRTAPGLVGRNVPRIDIPAKLAGKPSFVQDLRLPGMLHGRVLRGPGDGTRVRPADLDAAARRPGIVRVVRDGRFVAVLADREWDAVTALRLLQGAGWTRMAPPLDPGDPNAALRRLPAQDIPIFDTPPGPPAEAARALSARYTRPYLMHGAIGPSCAVALWQDGALTVWTHSQGVSPLRRALAELLGLPSDRVRCIHTPGSGCYGHNGADDVAADAAVAARAVPGRPVRVQWSREQEHGWEPLGPAMTVDLDASLDASGRIVRWRHAVWSNGHDGRPTSASGLLAGAELDPPFPPQVPKPIPMPEGGGDRNANPLYDLPDASGVYRFIPDAPVRVSALRSLGAHMNVFAIESFMDELARAAARDPVAFRLAHMTDPRARAVMREAADRFGWQQRRPGGGGRGSGFAFARYKNLGAYCAIALEVTVDPDSAQPHVTRVVAAVDSGEAVNPDGIANQIEGAIVQSLSWTLHEAVALDATGRASFDWSTYPILRFADVPDRVEVHVLGQPGQPFLGTGEAGQGPTAAAVANALADAVGARCRAMPITPERIGAALPLRS